MSKLDKSGFFSESYLEKKLREEVKKLGGLAQKFTSPGNSGVQDRIVFMPGGRIFLVEVKKTGGTPRKLQDYWVRTYTKLGFKCYLIDSPESIKKFIDEIKGL